MDDATERRILSQNFVHFYAGDTWRITADTSLTYGLRWELHTVPDETQGLALLPVGGAEAVLDPNAVVDFAGAAAGRPFLNSDRNNFAPNIGVARQLTDKLVLRAGYSLNYVFDNNLTTVSNAVGNNEGLSQTVVLPGVGGTVSGGGLVPVEAPEFKIPRTARDGILADSTAALFTFDPDLRTPSVRQWNLGLQYQLLPDTAVEVRYVGNRGNDLLRGVDRNQLLLPDAFVEDFRRAQRNLAANGAPWLGEPLQIFPLLGLGASCSRGGVQNWIRNGEIGQYICGFLAPNRIFFFNGEGGERFGATLPIGYFYTNPNTFVGDVVGNHAFSEYDALQLEVRRAWRAGLTAQFNYTWGQVTTAPGLNERTSRCTPSSIRAEIALSLMALAVTLLSGSPALADDGTKHDLFQRIQEQVLRYSFFTVFDNIDVEIAEEGHVVLTGHVTGSHKASDIEKRVVALDGVTAVTNEIAVLPASGFDDRLRYAIARAIYGNPTFWHYAASTDPSIHIVVQRGHVTLTGVVDSETDRQLARALAAQFNAFSVTNRLRLPHEVTMELEALG